MGIFYLLDGLLLSSLKLIGCLKLLTLFLDAAHNSLTTLFLHIDLLNTQMCISHLGSQAWARSWGGSWKNLGQENTGTSPAMSGESSGLSCRVLFLGPGGATARNGEAGVAVASALGFPRKLRAHHSLPWPAIAHGPAPAQATVPSGGRAAAAPATVLKARRIKLCWRRSIFGSQYFQNELLTRAAGWLGKGPGHHTAG